MFTFLIGREVGDIREVRWMACVNRGNVFKQYFTAIYKMDERYLKQNKEKKVKNTSACHKM